MVKNIKFFCNTTWITLRYLADRILPVAKPVQSYYRYSKGGLNFLIIAFLIIALCLSHYYMMAEDVGNFVNETGSNDIEITGEGNDNKVYCYSAIFFSLCVLILSTFAFYRDLVWIYTADSVMPFPTSNIYAPIVFITIGYSLRIFLFTFAAIIGSLGVDLLTVADNGQSIFTSSFNSISLSNLRGVIITSLEIPFFSISLDMSAAGGFIPFSYLWLLTIIRWFSVSFLLGTFWSVLPRIFDRLITNRKSSFHFNSISPHIEMKLLGTQDNVVINPGFQNLRRALSYFYTQNVIIPKESFYKKICDRLVNDLAGRSSINFFLPGVGTGDFITYLLDNVTLPECEQITIVGADASSEMLFVGLESLFLKIEENNTNLAKRIRIDLILTGSLIDTKCNFYNDLISEYGTFDVILSSQFDHYFPNTENSQLAEQLKQDGKTFSIKKDYYSKCSSLLSEKGIFITLDDEKISNTIEQEKRDRKWDEYVATQFTNTTILFDLSEKLPWLERHIKELYPNTLPMNDLITRVSSNRQRRRSQCMEEICSKKEIKDSLKSVFNTAHVTELDNPAINTHAGFFMFYVTLD